MLFLLYVPLLSFVFLIYVLSLSIIAVTFSFGLLLCVRIMFVLVRVYSCVCGDVLFVFCDYCTFPCIRNVFVASYVSACYCGDVICVPLEMPFLLLDMRTPTLNHTNCSVICA